MQKLHGKQFSPWFSAINHLKQLCADRARKILAILCAVYLGSHLVVICLHVLAALNGEHDGKAVFVFVVNAAVVYVFPLLIATLYAVNVHVDSSVGRFLPVIATVFYAAIYFIHALLRFPQFFFTIVPALFVISGLLMIVAIILLILSGRGQRSPHSNLVIILSSGLGALAFATDSAGFHISPQIISALIPAIVGCSTEPFPAPFVRIDK